MYICSMANNEKVVQVIGSYEPGRLVKAFNALQGKADSPEENQRVMNIFEKEWPGVFDFVHQVDESEKSIIKDSGTEEEQLNLADNPEEFTPYAYGMLMGFLTLREMAITTELEAKIGKL